jgi:endonuclease/exonuclease/phosphatase family metal-dependent hydrolase
MAGGIVTSWRRDLWHATSSTHRFSITTKLTLLNSPGEPWWLTNVYGPTTQADKAKFLLELRDVRVACLGPWLLCGDFNLIYMAHNKNNGWLHHGLMRRFRRVLDDLQLDEIHLSGRLYTWSNGRDQPTLERLDRAFATVDWVEMYPNHQLCCLSSDCSDHVPLLLVLNSEPWAKPRFRFDQY